MTSRIAKVGRTDPFECSHDNITDHYAWGGCGTPFCPGWVEAHCRDCGYFITECPCGHSRGIDGWSWARRKAQP